MPQRKGINVRRVLTLGTVLLLLVVLLGGGYVYRRRQVAAKFRHFREVGLAAHAAGDPAGAVGPLGDYLARYPDDLPALLAYAADREAVDSPGGQNVVQAIQALRLALRLDPSLLEERRHLMHLYTQTGYATEAMDAADAILTAHPRDADALSTRAGALIRLRRFADAMGAVIAWAESDPAAIDARLDRLELLREAQRPKAEATALADAWAREWSTHPPAASPRTVAASAGVADLFRGHAQLVYGDVAAATGPLTAAAADAALHSPPQTAGLALAGDLDAIRQPDLARSVVHSLFDADPTNDDVRLDLARRDWEAHDYQPVVDLTAGAKRPARVPARMLGLQAVALVELHRGPEAEPVRQALLARTADDPSAAAWAAVVSQFLADRFDAAAVVTACRPVLERQDDIFLRYFLGEAYARLGERDLAARQWQRVIADDLSWAEPAIRLCRVRTEAGRSDAALEAGFEGARRAPHSGDALVALAAAWTATIQSGHGQDADGCLHLVEQLAAALPADGRLPPIHAALLLALNRPDDAAAVIRGALAAKPIYPAETWERLAALSQASGLHLEAACLARAQRDDGMTAALAYARAAGLFAAGHAADGLSSYDADRRLAGPATAADPLAWDLNRAVYLDLTHDPSAAAAWRALSDAHADDVHVQQLALAAQCVRGDGPAMDRVVGRLGQLTNRQGSGYALARARYLVQYGTTAEQADESRRLLDDLLRQTPDSVDAHVLSARAYEVANHPADAAADLRAAADLLPSAASIRLSLARLLQAQGDFEAAREQLAGLHADQLSGGDQRRQAAVLLAQQGQWDKAIGLLEEEARAGAETSTAQLTLAGLHLRNNDPARAEAVVRRLLADRPDAAAVEFGADLLARTNRLPEARRLLDRLDDPRTAGTANGVAQLARADFDLRYGPADRPDAALAEFAAATAAGPTNPVAWRARVAANLLTARPGDALAVAADGLRHVPADPVLTAVQRQSAALAYAATDPDARPMLVPFLRDPAASSAAATTLGAIYAAASAHQPLPLLATRLQELSDQFPRFLPLHLYLIGVDQRLNRLDDAATAAARAAQSFPDDASPLRVEAGLLARLDRWPEVLAVAARWRDRFPAEALAADAAAADALVHLNRPGEAIARLQPYAAQPGTPAYDAALPLLAAARRAAGQTGSATLLGPLLTKGPAGRLSWMQFAVNSLPPDEADTWIRQALAAMPPLDPVEHVRAAGAYLKLAERSPGPDAARFTTAALDVLQPLLAGDHPAAPVLMAAAECRERLADSAAAADLYRRVLVLTPDDPIAGNNLALILNADGHPGDALPLIDAALRRLDTAADLYDTRSLVLDRLGRTDDALAANADALRIEPGRVAFHVRRATFLADAGRAADAVDVLRALDAMHLDTAAAPADVQADLLAVRRRLLKTATTAPNVTATAGPP